MQALDGVERLRKLGIRTAVVTAAVVAITAAALVLNSGCFADTKTNLCEASGRRCAPGQVCAAAQDACIPIGGCGDGIVDTTRGEICDDGNIENGDGCNRDCGGIEKCGDGVIDPDEDCDSGGTDSPSCDLDCTFIECGDTHVNTAAGEECDFADRANTPGCNGFTCKSSACGDSYHNPVAGEACDTGGDTQACNGDNGSDSSSEVRRSCQTPSCGDGYTNPRFITAGGQPEQCDGGRDTLLCNGKDDDNNSSTNTGVCQFSKCGDGYINRAAAEKCDPGLTPDRSDDIGCDGNKRCINQCSECSS